MRSRIALIVVGFVLVAGALALWVVAGGVRRTPAPTGPSASASGAAKGLPVRGNASPTRATYAVTIKNDIHLPAKPQHKHIVIAVSGMLTLTLGPTEGDTTYVRGRFYALSSDVKHSDDSERARVPPEEVDFGLLLEKSGRIARVAFDPAVPEFTESLLRQVLSEWQLVRPAERTSSWRFDDEEDATGRCITEYQQPSDDAVVKRKHGCRRPEAPEQMGSPEVLGRAQYTLSPVSQWVQRLQSDIQALLPTNGEPVKTHNVVELKLENLGPERAAARFPPFWVATRLGAQRARREAKKPLRHDQDTASTVSWLRGADQPTRELAQDTLAQLFVERRGEIDKALELFRSSEDRDVQLTLLGAMSDADTPEAQQALLDAARSPGVDPEMKESAVVSLLASREPQPSTLEGLKKLATDPSVAADLREVSLNVLGGVARTAERTESGFEVANETASYLEQQAAKARSSTEKAMYLTALGNTGSTNAQSAALAALESKDPEVRAAAVDALRHIPTPEATKAILRVLLSDPASSVRTSAVQALSVRQIDEASFAALARAATGDTAAEVRMEAVAVLGRLSLRRPAALGILAQIARTDAVPEIREMAAKFVDGSTVK